MATCAIRAPYVMGCWPCYQTCRRGPSRHVTGHGLLLGHRTPIKVHPGRNAWRLVASPRHSPQRADEEGAPRERLLAKDAAHAVQDRLHLRTEGRDDACSAAMKGGWQRVRSCHPALCRCCRVCVARFVAVRRKPKQAGKLLVLAVQRVAARAGRQRARKHSPLGVP